MADKKRNILDDVVDGIRQTLDDLERALRPDKQREPARIPIPVRPEYPPVPKSPRDDRYR